MKNYKKTNKLIKISFISIIFAILQFIAPRIGATKLSICSSMILLGAYFYGPIGGLLVGFFGRLIVQILQGQINIVLPIWLIGTSIRGLLSGITLKLVNINSNKFYFIYFIISIITSIINNFAVMLQGQLFGYYTQQLTLLDLIIRLLGSVIIAIIDVNIVRQISKRVKLR